MSNANRRGQNAPGRNPTPAEIRALREKHGASPADFGRLVYSSASAVEKWESGESRLHPATWEYLNLLLAYPEVRAARESWLASLAP